MAINNYRDPNYQYRRTTAADLLPQLPEMKKVLRERAHLHGKMEQEKSDRRDGITYVRFKLGEHEFYGVPYHLVSEVIGYVPLTKMSTLPDFIAGVINRRGSLSAVLDLKKFFNFKSQEYGKNSYILIMKANDITIGILADTIEGSDSYAPLSLEQPLSSGSAIKSDFVIGIDKGDTAIINIEVVLTDVLAKLAVRSP